MESERANLEYQIQMQQECVDVKDAEMKKMREQIEQVKLRLTENVSLHEFRFSVCLENSS